MNDRTLTPELARTAAYARVRAAKNEFTKATVACLLGKPSAEGMTTVALEELRDARAELARLGSEDQERGA